ncbi:c-type cytochrome [Salegentibacter chungangensis]|uniref:C-type cytochrome n=1 Tax=Salegentibacter chungangensis TaxID=1335724 RepID=A0ABW3NQM9_9FLAO
MKNYNSPPSAGSRLPFKKTFSLLFVLSLFVALPGCKEKAKEYEEVKKPGKNEMSQKDLIKRGEYLVTSIGCADCHSPKKVGGKPMEEDAGLKLSGYRQGTDLPEIDQNSIKNGWMLMNSELTAAVGPWGVSFAANLTSHETGIGNWSFDQFKTAMTKGKFKGMENGRDILPPMPWQNFANLTEEDLKAMYHYLQSTKPIDNAVPAPIPPNQMDSLYVNK